MQNIEIMVRKQREFFRSGRTIDISCRKNFLKKLREVIQSHEKEIERTLKEDLGKSGLESFMCEIGLSTNEIHYQMTHIDRWAKDKLRYTELVNFPATSWSTYEPYGVVLIMSPWNYPFMLAMEPLAGAVAAGNTVILKPSAYSPATSAMIKTIIEETFPPEYVAVVEGGRAENQALLDQRFDYIFFTGGTTVGRLVMEKAAKYLTPVSLEMGGKSPCVVTENANLKLAARRLVFGKFLNCGQTCVAPDYVLVERTIKDRFLELVSAEIRKQFGERPLENPDYGKIINRKHFERLCGLIDPAKITFGGRTEPEKLRIEPTILDNVTVEDYVMQEEIFGPILPVISYTTIEEAERFIREREKPLALYLFTNDRQIEKRFLKYVPFGGGCVNDTIMHMVTAQMGFGGVGYSGMGSYHGRKSFDTFSHEKNILKKSTRIDLPMRYQPYGNKLYEWMIRKILK